MLFLEVSEVWLGSYWAVYSIILEAETNLTLTSLLEREKQTEEANTDVARFPFSLQK